MLICLCSDRSKKLLIIIILYYGKKKKENVVEELHKKVQHVEETKLKVDESKFESAEDDSVIKVDLSKKPEEEK